MNPHESEPMKPWVRRLRVFLGWRIVKKLWHVPTDPRLDYCTCGQSWPCWHKDRLRYVPWDALAKARYRLGQAESRVGDLWYIVQGRCPYCTMRGTHKMGCPIRGRKSNARIPRPR